MCCLLRWFLQRGRGHHIACMHPARRDIPWSEPMSGVVHCTARAYYLFKAVSCNNLHSFKHALVQLLLDEVPDVPIFLHPVHHILQLTSVVAADAIEVNLPCTAKSTDSNTNLFRHTALFFQKPVVGFGVCCMSSLYRALVIPRPFTFLFSLKGQR